VPVKYPDPQRLSQLPGYEEERGKIIANVEALLHDQPAVNMLLYGDAGTGKSSTIKALANEYRSDGLRLIEVRRNQLFQIPAVLEKLAPLPLKFILFIDDLSFSSNDENFASLKAILEGSVSKQASNTILAATSNRRHLVKESVSDRFQDDLHESDTRQELLSLSARFGLIVTFQKPDRSRYLYIVQELAKEYGVEEDEGTLIAKAEAFALRAGGRTPRVARQFVEQIKSGVL
jgi:predicted AAA+ superfamily ATPase